MTHDRTRRFLAHDDGSVRHTCWVEARSFETAALAFADRRAAQAQGDAQAPGDRIDVIVQDETGGDEHCFRVQLDNRVTAGFA